MSTETGSRYTEKNKLLRMHEKQMLNFVIYRNL